MIYYDYTHTHRHIIISIIIRIVGLYSTHVNLHLLHHRRLTKRMSSSMSRLRFRATSVYAYSSSSASLTGFVLFFGVGGGATKFAKNPKIPRGASYIGSPATARRSRSSSTASICRNRRAFFPESRGSSLSSSLARSPTTSSSNPVRGSNSRVNVTSSAHPRTISHVVKTTHPSNAWPPTTSPRASASDACT